MNTTTTRREFVQRAVWAGIGIPSLSQSVSVCDAAPQQSRSANQKLNLAVVGVAARGGANLNGVSSENIVALCDIDSQRLAQAAKQFPSAKTTDDFRDVLDMPNLDGVVVSTPDHMHAFVVVPALKRKLNVYCEKPLTHSVWEARQIRKLTREAGVVTQMGTQIHAGTNYRRVVEIVQAGVIGAVRRVHVWQGGGVRVGQRVASGKPPQNVNYDLWLGPAPYRPYHPSHFHFNWRYWWDFGGGQLADFGCHYMDLPFWALGLTAPTTVSATGQKGHSGDNLCPNKMRVEYAFPARGEQPPVHLTWYHGGLKPQGADEYGKGSAVLFEGEYGRLLADYSTRKLFLQAGRKAEQVKQTIPNSIGHHQEWIHAIKTGGTTTCHFEYGGNLTESVLLGNVSYRAGQKKLEWDAARLTATNCAEAAPLIRRKYRKGWSLDTV